MNEHELRTELRQLVNENAKLREAILAANTRLAGLGLAVPELIAAAKF